MTMSPGSCRRTITLTAITSADPQIRSADLVLLHERAQPPGHVSGGGPVYVMQDTGQEGLLEARYRLARFKIAIAERPFNLAGVDYPAGSWLLAPQPGLAAALRDTAAALGLEFASAASTPSVLSHEAPVPRLGIWVPWADTDTIGWARYALDQRHIPYVYVRDEDIRAGNLRGKYDVLLYGHVDLELAEQIHGIPRAWGPMAFKKTPATPSFGTPAESDDITGGIGWSGLGELQRFVESGGLLITLGNGSMLPLEAGIVRGVRRESGGVPRSSQGGGAAASAAARSSVTATPGSHVRVSLHDPITPSRMATRIAPTCSGKTSRSIPFLVIGCAWRTARPVSTVRSIPAVSCSNGAIAKASPSWSAVRHGERRT